MLTEGDRWLLEEGTHQRLHDVLGGRLTPDGAVFKVWAPHAERVSVVADFNGWEARATPLEPAGGGVWAVDVPGTPQGTRYKFLVERFGWSGLKTDPFGYYTEEAPGSASILWDLSYDWGDDAWLAGRGERQAHDAPMAIYEMHLGSWQGPTRYRTIADPLIDYLTEMGYTHVEMLPVMEHPFYGSWGYQSTGYFAATSRYGEPQDLMYLIDRLHQAGIGVILDWVPSHFPMDAAGLVHFDGTHLYESADWRIGYHPDWGSAIFDYGRPEVRAFLISSAHFWIEQYHADGLRVDAVASMLYRDYSRREGEWVANKYGGNENLEAVDFIRELNGSIYARHPDVHVIAEESTSWPQVSKPIDEGGLGFGFKWDMGWMNDTLRYLAREPIHRRFHHNELTFRAMYAGTENFVLPLSHDEVVHGKGSLLSKQPGDEWQRFAGLRLLLGHMWTTPGKKLLFMGGDFGATSEWNHDAALPWHLLEEPSHAGVKAWVADLNRTYRAEPALHLSDTRPEWFEWLAADDASASTIAFARHAEGARTVVVVSNFTPEVWSDYRLGVPLPGRWEELLNSDAVGYGGSGVGNLGGVETEPVAAHGQEQSVVIGVPPLSTVVFGHVARAQKGKKKR